MMLNVPSCGNSFDEKEGSSCRKWPVIIAPYILFKCIHMLGQAVEAFNCGVEKGHKFAML